MVIYKIDLMLEEMKTLIKGKGKRISIIDDEDKNVKVFVSFKGKIR